MKLLTDTQINQALQKLEGWEFVDNAIETTLEFTNFKEAFTVMTRIAFEAEAMQHHPEWTNVYNQITIKLSTHDAGGVTEKDIDLALIIDQIIAE